MKPAMCAAFDYTIPFAQVIPMIQHAGFEVVSIGARPQHSGYHTEEGRARIKKLIVENGLEIDSVHAPFPEGDQLCSLDETKRMESLRQCKIAADAAQDLNVGVIVIHLDKGNPDPHIQNQIIDQGIKSIGTLATYAIKKGIKVAIENGMGQTAVLDRILTEFSEDPIGFCYDSGHENVDQTTFRVLQKHGHRLLTVHLHDNLGSSDTHTLPYEGNIDWDRFRRIFHGLGYSGNLLLEADIANSQFKDIAVFLAEARKRAERLLQCPVKDHKSQGQIV